MQCENCRFGKRKLSYLGFRNWCVRYKRFSTIKCIDFVPR